MKGTFAIVCMLILMLSACRQREIDPSPSPGATLPAPSQTQSSSPAGSATPEVSSSLEPAEAPGASLRDNTFSKQYKIDGNSGEVQGELYISLPEVMSEEYPENAAVLSDYFRSTLEKSREGFEEELQEYAEDADLYGLNSKYYTDISYQTEYNRRGLISIQITKIYYSGGAHDNILLDSLTFDLASGTRIIADQLFEAEEMVYTARIKEWLLDEIERQLKSPDVYYFENHRELLDITFNKEQFVLTEEGLCIYFQVYDLAPYAAGIVQFVIPYGELEDILNPAFGLVDKEG